MYVFRIFSKITDTKGSIATLSEAGTKFIPSSPVPEIKEYWVVTV